MSRLRALPPRIATLDMRIGTPPPKRADPFYLMPEWRGLVTRLIRERGRRCEACWRPDCRIYGDHIQEIADGGALLDPANVRLLCGSCHTTKSNRARAARQGA